VARPGAVEFNRVAAKPFGKSADAKSVVTTILTVNAGSSSTRLAAYRLADGGTEPVARAHVEAPDRPTTDILNGFVDEHDLTDVDVVAHRVVHGGALSETCWITGAVEEDILRLAALAPLHNRRALTWIGACRTRFGASVRQAAAFDTAFFTTLPQVASTYALPLELVEAHGLRRFGFHGLAHHSMVRDWQRADPHAGAGARLITIQLGSGCSMAAVRDGRPIDTSMGFTPLEGLAMATRSGDLDPGLLIYLLRECGLSTESLDGILNTKSGLLGMSVRSADMRELLACRDEASTLAVDVYCYRVRKYIGAYLAALNGADAILFGGGVSENSPEVRQRILSDLDRLGIILNGPANRRTIGHRGCISAAASAVAVWVIPVDEERAVVEEVLGLMARGDDIEAG